jgi:uncharacterized surface protein with fasciclin (FAS1) repeats
MLSNMELLIVRFFFSSINSPPAPLTEPATLHLPQKDDIACTMDGFENICDAINFAGLNDTTFKGGEWTIFLPNNDAINDDLVSTMFYESLEFNAFTPFLKNLLLYHSSPNATIYRSDLSCLEGQNILHMTTGRISRTLCDEEENVPTFQIGEGNLQDDILPMITKFDIEACNGVVHVIDKLIHTAQW